MSEDLPGLDFGLTGRSAKFLVFKDICELAIVNLKKRAISISEAGCRQMACWAERLLWMVVIKPDIAPCVAIEFPCSPTGEKLTAETQSSR